MNEIGKTLRKPVSMLGQPSVYMKDVEFGGLIYSKGYNIFLDKFLSCPCKEKGNSSARVTCKNCHGTGFFLAERLQTKAFLSSMNKSTDYKDWSIENIGTVSITTLATDKVAFMDRVVLYEIENPYSQLIYPISTNNHMIAFLDYPPTSIESIYMFNGDNNPLVKLDPALVVIGEEGEIDLTNFNDILYSRSDFVYNQETTFSIRYNYMPSYHILDVERNIIQSPVENEQKQLEYKNFPYHSIGRMSHLVIERGNLLSLPSNWNLNTEATTSKVEQFSENLNLDKVFCETEKLAQGD